MRRSYSVTGGEDSHRPDDTYTTPNLLLITHGTSNKCVILYAEKNKTTTTTTKLSKSSAFVASVMRREFSDTPVLLFRAIHLRGTWFVIWKHVLRF